MRVLVTGGAGFIGTHLCRRLLSERCRVSVLDNFSNQIHSSRALVPDLHGKVALIPGDIRDSATVAEAINDQDVVVHLAAETGTGQSMYEVTRYQDINIGGTAVLIEELLKQRNKVQKIVLASSRAVYGEGQYDCREHGSVFPSSRQWADLNSGVFQPRCPQCNCECSPRQTAEGAPFHPSSFYGLTKQVQEQMVHMFAGALGISAYSLRYQNVYGPGQSLKNPYTGILAIFSNQARTDQPINIFEDGEESRDFVYIDDVVEATWRSIARPENAVVSLNIGSGEVRSVTAVVREIVQFFASQSRVAVTGAFRLGDIRHNCADMTRAKEILGFTPQWKFEVGLRRFLMWVMDQDLPKSTYLKSLSEMREHGLYHEQ